MYYQDQFQLASLAEMFVLFTAAARRAAVVTMSRSLSVCECCHFKLARRRTALGRLLLMVAAIHVYSANYYCTFVQWGGAINQTKTLPS